MVLQKAHPVSKAVWVLPASLLACILFIAITVYFIFLTMSGPEDSTAKMEDVQESNSLKQDVEASEQE